MMFRRLSDFTTAIGISRALEPAAPDPRVLALSREFATTNPDEVTHALELSRRGQVQAAVELLQHAADGNREKSVQHLRTLARIVTPSNPNEAIAAYRKVLQASPDDDAAMRDLADMLIRLGRFDEARAPLATLLEDAKEPRAKAAANALAAIVYARSGDTKAAEAHFQIASANTPRNTSDRATLVLLLAQAAEAMGKGDEAAALYADACRASDTARAPNAYADAELGFGRLALAGGKPADAEVHFRQALAMREYAGSLPGVADALIWIGFCRAAVSTDDAEAAAVYEQALSLYRRLDDALGMITALEALASIAAEKGDQEKASAFAEEASVLAADKGLVAAPRVTQVS